MAFKYGAQLHIGDKVSDKICAKKVIYTLNLQKKIFIYKLNLLLKNLVIINYFFTINFK